MDRQYMPVFQAATPTTVIQRCLLYNIGTNFNGLRENKPPMRLMTNEDLAFHRALNAQTDSFQDCL
jgi:hypothetical protein